MPRPVPSPDAVPARPVTLQKIVKGSTAVLCSRCGGPVWATPGHVKFGLEEKLVCPRCAPKHSSTPDVNRGVQA